MFWFDPMYFLYVSPALLLAAWAQWRVKSSYGRAMQMPARMSGFEVARFILDQSGLQNIPIEPTQGELSDHYDPSSHIVRLSADVYYGRTLGAVGIAAHEVGHALQHAQGYLPMGIRSLAVPAAQYGPTLFMILALLGMFLGSPKLILLGLVAYGGIVLFQLVNLPVEFDASNRAKRILADTNIIDAQGSAVVRDVLNAAGWTYVAATLQSILTLLYYAMVLTGGSRRNRD